MYASACVSVRRNWGSGGMLCVCVSEEATGRGGMLCVCVCMSEEAGGVCGCCVCVCE